MILITGADGFIGSHLCELIPDAYCIDLKRGSDICDDLPDENFTHIFHLAASKSVPVGEQNPKTFISNNCWGTVNLLKKYPNVRFINVSSSSANEVKSIYGATKAFSESVGNFHKNCLNVRLYNVFGEGQPVTGGAVVPQFVYSKLQKSKPIIYGDGSQTRDFTYVKDVVHELKRLMFETNETGLWHLGYSNPMSVLDLCKRICGETEITFFPKRPFDIENSNSFYAMRIKYGREEGLKRTIEWYENEYSRTRV